MTNISSGRYDDKDGEERRRTQSQVDSWSGGEGREKHNSKSPKLKISSWEMRKVGADSTMSQGGGRAGRSEEVEEVEGGETVTAAVGDSGDCCCCCCCGCCCDLGCSHGGSADSCSDDT